MRIEKGHVAGGELNGQSTALNMGLGRMVSKKKDSIGMVLSQREGLTDPGGYRLVGVRPVDPRGKLTAGSHFLEIGAAAVAANDRGWLTSKAYSPHIGSDIALGYLKAGDRKIGQRMRAVNLLTGQDTEVEIVSPHFFDPEGERLRG
jgi:sarcosine oxidase subunit alpha